MAVEPNTTVLSAGGLIERGARLRYLPGKRDVFAGSWDGRAVVAKVYLDRRRAAVHAQREIDGLTAFQRAGVAAPEVLYDGTDDAGNRVVVLQRIEPAVSLGEAWDQADKDGRRDLLEAMMGLLADHHRAGLCQKDLHLGNFLLTDECIYSLDGAAVDGVSGELDETASLQNLALFCSQLSPRYDELCVCTAARYALSRGWPETVLAKRLPAAIAASRWRRWTKLRAKLYRECTAIVHRTERQRDMFVVREHADELAPLLADLEATCPADPAQRLKNGNTATVWRVSTRGLEVVVKRYNVKHRMHGLMLAGKESRASVSWRNAHLLRLFGIDTPAPLALVLGRRRPFGRIAYFLAESVDGLSLRDWVTANRDDGPAMTAIACRLGEVFARLRDMQLSHGDTKATNFIVRDDGICVIDLDAMRRHRSRRAFERARHRDLQRFIANWSHDPATLALLREHIGE